MIKNLKWPNIRAKIKYSLRRAFETLRGIDVISSAYLNELCLSAEVANPYIFSGTKTLKVILDGLDISETDAIIDFGCGKGGVLIAASEYPFKKIGGVEISKKLYGTALKNIKRLRLNNIEVFSGNAANFQELDEFNYFYFFHPFPCDVMAQVIANIEESLNRQQRKATIIYKNPICENVILRSGFTKVKEVPAVAGDYNGTCIYGN